MIRQHWSGNGLIPLTYRGRVTHICVSKLTIIGSDNGLSPGRRQAIILTNAEILLIGPLETNFSEILIEVYTFSFKKMHVEMSSGKWRPFCLGLNVLSNVTLCARFQNDSVIETDVMGKYDFQIFHFFCFFSGRGLSYIWSTHRLLTHCGPVTPYDDRKLGEHWLR